jgi:hypothetical protein
MYSRCLHRQMWFDAYGEIAKGFQVHHKNGDAFDNRIDNFELVERINHLKTHGKERVTKDPAAFKRLAEIGREYAKEWHRSEVGIEWHKKHAKDFNFGVRDYGEFACLSCNKPFNAKRGSQKFCSNACKSAFRRNNNPDMITRKCDKCGSEYITRKYLPAYYCSKQCKPAPNPFGRKGKLLES